MIKTFNQSPTLYEFLQMYIIHYSMFHAKTTAVQYMGTMVVVPGLGVVRDVSRQTNSNPAERDKDW